MTKQDALRLLEDTLHLPAHTLHGTEKLREVEGWDSLATLGFIAAVDKKLGLALPGGKVARCQSVAELIALLGPAVTDRAA